MPMSFPNLDSLMERAKQRGFRQPVPDESEDEYRNAFADFMANVDFVESAEIRSSRGWDQMLPEELLGNLLGKNRGVSTAAKSDAPARGETEHFVHLDDSPFANPGKYPGE